MRLCCGGDERIDIPFVGRNGCVFGTSIVVVVAVVVAILSVVECSE